MDSARSFAQALKRCRKARDLTQQELAEQIGCALVTIQRIEQGTLRPSRQIVQRLVAILDISADERERFVRLARNVSQQELSEAQPDATPSARSPRSLLPRPLTPLIGRVQEVAALSAALADSRVRLLTLTGPGGIGKTRLALQAAADLAASFAHGAVFVDLAPIGDSDLVANAIAQVLGLPDLGSQPLLVMLQRYLRDKQLLLVLDNFEQVVRAAPLVAALLEAAPRLKVLITSRVIVSVYGEHAFLVPPLTLPNPNDVPAHDQLLQAEAVRLFVERAQAARLDFRLTDANAHAVSAICQHLDGLPLAIELAAARVRLLPPQALLQRITQRGSGRLQLLTGGSRTLPTRQQTLRATLAWSYELLELREQRLFRRLAVFVGGCTLEAASEVLSFELKGMNEEEPQLRTQNSELKTLEGLTVLLDTSLLLQREGADGASRFTMLETIREYALEQLIASGELEALRRRHAAFFVTLAEAAKPGLIGPQQVTWMNRLEMEHPNLGVALVWSLETEDAGQPTTDNGQRTELGLRLTEALSSFWARRGYLSEGRAWLTHALSRTEAGGASGPPTAEYRMLRAQTLTRLGILAVWQGDLAAAQPAYEESLTLYRELGNIAGIANVLGHFGLLIEAAQSDHGRAEVLLEESLSMYRELGEAHRVAGSLFLLGVLAYSQGNSRRAGDLWEESLTRFRASGDMYSIAMVLTHCGMLALDQGDHGRAGAHLAESLTLLRKLGARWQTAHALEVFAGLLAARGQQPDDSQAGALRAARLLGAVEALRETLVAPPLLFYRDYYQRMVTAARALLHEATFAAVWAAGRAMTLEQAIAYVLDESDPPAERPRGR